MTQRATLAMVAAVAVGGAVGGLLRWSAGELVADGRGFPTTTFAINVLGSLLLALLPALPVVRRTRTLAVALGPGLLGGFTTLSAASEQTRALLDAGSLATAALYVLGTLAAALAAIEVASRLSTAADQRAVEDEGGDE